MGKITRSRNGCFTCKQRRRKCDETKPECNNCTSSGRQCAGYGIRLVFDVDDSRNDASKDSMNSKGEKKYGFRGRPRMKETLARTDIKGVHNLVMEQATPATTIASVSSSTTEVSGMNSAPMNSRISSTSTSTAEKTFVNRTPQQSEQSNNVPESGVKNTDTNNSNNSNLSATVSPSTTATSTGLTPKNHSDIDITDPFQFENALYDGLDYLLNTADQYMNTGNANTNNNNQQYQQLQHTPYTPSNLQSPQIQLLDLIDPQVPSYNSSQQQQRQQDGQFQFPKESPFPPRARPVVKQEQQEQDEQTSFPPHTAFADKTNLYPLTPLNPSTNLSHSEDNYILKHFFDKLIPLLDAHPSSPWPELMIKFGSFELAKSCFLSLSSIHLYVNNGENEFYKKGILHINNTMEYLIKYVRRKDGKKRKSRRSGAGIVKKGKIDKASAVGKSHTGLVGGDESDDDESVDDDDDDEESDDEEDDALDEDSASSSSLNVEKIVTNLKNQSAKRRQTNFFVILLLLYVHLLFAVLESGRSALSRIFLKLFASIAEDQTFKTVLNRIDQSQTLICVLSWFDTISAVVSPDYRVPFCRTEWYGTKNDLISTAKMNGCPGEIFSLLHELCHLRNKIYNEKMANDDNNKNNNNDNNKNNAIKSMEKGLIFDNLKSRLFNYRDYVPLILPNSFPYDERLKAAQCWSLSTYIRLLSLFPNEADYDDQIECRTLEFISVYKTLDSKSPIVTQMVWPVFNVAIYCKSPDSRAIMMEFMSVLYDTVKMGTVMTMMRLSNDVWEQGKTVEELLSGKEWLGAGIDYLPC